ncbi:MAG: glycosyltransferase family 2 protein [Bacteroidia bacterium]
MAQCSVVIIAINAQNTIELCVKSALQITDDVILVDSGSTDKTVELAQKAGAKIFYKEWIGYSANKNFGNSKAKNDFIFWLDADEAIPMLLADEVKSVLKNINNDTCYTVNRLNFFNNKPVYFGGWNPDWQVRLFNKNNVMWDESMTVHEQLNISKVKHVIKLKNKLHHYTVNNLNEYLTKSKKYAQQYRQSHKNGNVLKMIVSPPFRFIKEFIFKAGILDGIKGLKIAFANAFYVYLKYKV